MSVKRNVTVPNGALTLEASHASAPDCSISLRHGPIPTSRAIRGDPAQLRDRATFESSDSFSALDRALEQNTSAESRNAVVAG
jgi:hypothetical protein